MAQDRGKTDRWTVRGVRISLQRAVVRRCQIEGVTVGEWLSDVLAEAIGRPLKTASGEPMGRRLAQLEARLALMEGGRIGLVAATADAADDAEPAVARSGPDRLARRSDAAMRDQALAMLAAGASQRKVADALGVAQSTVAAWKKHHADPS